MNREDIIKRLEEIIEKQKGYYAFNTHTKPLIEELINELKI